MAHVVKRVSKKHGTRWRVRWQGADGSWLSETYGSKKEADKKKADLEAGQAGGTNDSVEDLCRDFLKHFLKLVERGTRERSSYEQYRQHVDHLKRYPIAQAKLHALKTPDVQRFLDSLLEDGMSDALLRKVRGSFGKIAKFGQQRGMLMLDPVRATEVSAKAVHKGAEDGDMGPVVIPSQGELAALLEAADGRTVADKGYAAAFVRVLLFCGLRISELRGLTWKNVIMDDSPHLLVVRKIDKWQEAGQPKNMSSRRKVPIGAATAAALKKWQAAARPSTNGYVFPNGAGNPENAANLWTRLWGPLCGAAGIAELVDRERVTPGGKPRIAKVWVPTYGFHAMRHAYASINIANNVPLKKLSELMGHTTIKTTVDLYGHLWIDDAEDSTIASAGENLISRAKR